MIKNSFIQTTENIITMAHRNFLKTLHDMDRLLDVIVQPVLFTLLFGFLFGGAISGSVHAYLPMLVPGILIQSLLNAASGSGQQLREDINSGIFDRFKTLPISPIAPLAGQLLGDVLRLFISGGAALITGFVIGWRPSVNFFWILVVLVLATFLGWSVSWLFALIGLIGKNAEMVGSLSMISILLLSFLSNAFIPTKTLPHLMLEIANINPVSRVITAMREILATGTWPASANLVLLSGCIIVLIFAPLAVWLYGKQS